MPQISERFARYSTTTSPAHHHATHTQAQTPPPITTTQPTSQPIKSHSSLPSRQPPRDFQSHPPLTRTRTPPVAPQ
ncbi:hypothetical protein BDW22DRAFT_1354403 [Trametopsis cervina]|nr:hypothetical protein BDW22DRAFT_1354403 [Trametopsis cervina]